jgi:hypothetical protein
MIQRLLPDGKIWSVVNLQNNPLFLQSFTGADDALKLHHIVHCSLDVIDERGFISSPPAILKYCLQVIYYILPYLGINWVKLFFIQPACLVIESFRWIDEFDDCAFR